MEVQNPFTQSPLTTPNLELTIKARILLKEMSSWTMFFAVLSFIGAGILAIAAFVIFLVGFGGMLGFAASTLIAILYGLIAVVCVFLGLYLLRFSQKVSKIDYSNNPLDLEVAFYNMKLYWKVSGILTIVAFCGSIFAGIIVGVLNVL